MTDYIMNLRKLVGHIPLILVAAGVIIVDDKGRVLLQQRTDNNKWGILGGGIEPGETVEEAAKREVYEESGLIVENIQLFNIYSGEEQHYTYPNGDEVYCINIVFITKNFQGDIRVDDAESRELKFFDIDNLPDDITPLCVPIMRDLKKYILTGG